ncbi:cell division protein ZipA C-terminal FtsZ-binding domain-containing protein [Methyloglobulus sp.]|uniref:cell division protein ZipA C-terminal FtsZ-binding domain-containing protein n=1 Tax=Methyloglobulus sp. TaxID=2518622 RepID=UPI0032B7A139
MDKELLRIVIIATGLLIIIGMILWSYIKGRSSEQDPDEFENEQAIGSSPAAIDPSLKIHHERDEFDIIPMGSAKHSFDQEEEDWDDGFVGGFNKDFDDEDPDSRLTIPDIIQFGVVADADEGFNGVDLVLAFQMVGLEYGDLKVYERINRHGDVDYGVACMVEPGTFPEAEDLMAFNCPGIVFYLQHRDLEDAQTVFEDFVDTIKTVARELDGVIWDHQRQPLTEATIQAILLSL